MVEIQNIRDLNILLLSICGFGENRRKEGIIFLVGVNEINIYAWYLDTVWLCESKEALFLIKSTTSHTTSFPAVVFCFSF